MTTVLVTGGAGFIGSHIADELVERGYRVRVLDSLHELAHPSRPDYLNSEVEHLDGDVRDPDACERAVRGVDAVSHQAAMVGLGSDVGDISAYAGHNSLGTAVLLRSLYERGFAGRIVLASSMVVYGEGRYRCPEHALVGAPPRTAEDLALGSFEPPCRECGRPLEPEAVPEDAPPDPRNVYAATKVNQEHLCGAFARESGSRLVSLRYHNVYGPRMPRDTPYAGVASLFRSALAAGRAPRVFEDGRQLRDFVHVRDVARANRLALEAQTVEGPFNVASGRARTVGDFARELSRLMEGPEPAVTGEFRLGDVRHVFASTERARAQLGFEAEISFQDGVAEFARAPLRATVGG